jgi:hypothetical protein
LQGRSFPNQRVSNKCDAGIKPQPNTKYTKYIRYSGADFNHKKTKLFLRRKTHKYRRPLVYFEHANREIQSRAQTSLFL